MWGYVLNPHECASEAERALMPTTRITPRTSRCRRIAPSSSTASSHTRGSTASRRTGPSTEWLVSPPTGSSTTRSTPTRVRRTRLPSRGVRRDVRKRNFTLTISSEVKPNDPAPTRWGWGAQGRPIRCSRSTSPLRFYLPDRLYLPVTPDEQHHGWSGATDPHHRSQRTGRPTPAKPCATPCTPPPGPSTGLSCSPRSPQPPVPFLRPLGPVGHPARRVPDSRLIFNQTQILKPLFQNTSFAFLIPYFYNETPSQSFFPQPGEHVHPPVHRPPARACPRWAQRVRRCHFKIPTTPGDVCVAIPDPNSNGTVKARYESLWQERLARDCYEHPAVREVSERRDDAADRNGWSRSCSALAQDRPKDATARCGVAWQKLSPYGNNFGVRTGHGQAPRRPWRASRRPAGEGHRPVPVRGSHPPQLPNTDFGPASPTSPTNSRHQAVPRLLLPRRYLHDSPSIRPHPSLWRHIHQVDGRWPVASRRPSTRAKAAKRVSAG